jgi:hypothetical protein
VQKAAAQDASRPQDPATTAMYIKPADIEIRSAVAQANARRPAATICSNWHYGPERPSL